MQELIKQAKELFERKNIFLICGKFIQKQLKKF